MKIHLDFDERLLRKYEKQASPPVFGIAWEHEGIYYPSKDWVDFGAVIVGWWLVVTSQLIRDKDEDEFLFMDGPYSIQVKYQREQNVVELTPKGGEIIWRVSFDELVEDLTSSAIRISEELARVGVGKEYQISLSKGIDMLKAT